MNKVNSKIRKVVRTILLMIVFLVQLSLQAQYSHNVLIMNGQMLMLSSYHLTI